MAGLSTRQIESPMNTPTFFETRETLILTQSPFNQLWFLKDTRGFHLGTFKEQAEAVKFAKENNYRLQYSHAGKVQWL